MNEDLNTMLLRLVQENLQTNQQWTETAVLFLNKLGEAVKADTERMRQSINHIENMIEKMTERLPEEITEQDRSVSSLEKDKPEYQNIEAQERYPASFYFRHPFPQDAAEPGYYVLITEEDDHLEYQLFDQQWQIVHMGELPDKTLGVFTAASCIAQMEGISDYHRNKMITEAVIDKVAAVRKSDESPDNGAVSVGTVAVERNSLETEVEGDKHDRAKVR